MPWGWQPAKNCFSDYYSPVGLRKEAHLPLRARQSKGVPWVGAVKTSDQKCVKSPFQVILVFYSMAGGECEDGPS